MFMERFEELCRKNGYTPSGVMVALGRSRSLAAKWKNTNATPSAEVLKELADFFGVTMDYLLGKEEMEDATTDPRQIIFDSYGHRVLFDVSKGCPESKLFEWASMIEKWKEESNGGT